MREFKVGDRVRCIAISRTYWGFIPDKLYLVAKVDARDVGLTNIDGGHATADQDSLIWWEKRKYFEIEDLDEGEVCSRTGRRGVKPYETV
jgi:hypothetical protein